MGKNRISTIMSIEWNRNFLFMAFILFLLVALTRPVSCQVVASFKSSRDFLRTNNGTFQTVFLLETDRKTYKRIVSNAGSMPETLTFTSRKVKKNKYQFSILFTHATEISYVKKTLLFLGIEKVKLNDGLFVLQDYNPEG